MRKLFFLFAALSLLSARAEDYTVASPDGHLTATISLTDGQLSYTVARDGKQLVSPSPLGITTTAVDLSQNLTFVSRTDFPVDETYTLPTGKTKTYRNHCNQLSLITERNGWRLNLQFRLFDDGVAFRYVVPSNGTLSTLTLTDEKSRIIMADFRSCLGCKFIGGVQSPNYPYEGLYNNYDWSKLTSGDPRLNAPALVTNGNEYVLLSEAANIGTWCTSLLRAESQKGTFSWFCTGDRKNYAEDKPQTLMAQLPLRTPWRMAVMGDLPTIFATIMTENLCPASTETDLSWIRPGRVAWYWGGSDGNKQEIRESYGGLEAGESAYADLAAEMGWEYTTIDGGWNSSWVENVVRRANEQGVEAILWQSARLKDSKDFSLDNMEKTLQQWQKWNIHGVKIDFWEDDSRETMARMEKLLQLCAKYHMLVDFHGSTRPSGLRRTYPHLMTQEGIYGGENNFWACKNITAAHHINLMLTRNVVGAADYTPGDIASHKGGLLNVTSIGHKMALNVGFESGLQHFAESPANYQYFLGYDIMKRIPVTWDESFLLEGAVSDYLTMARRNGQDWWVAGLTTQARNSKVVLDFLEDGVDYTAYIYRDGTNRTEMKFTQMTVTKGKTVNIPEVSAGGFLMQISPSADLPVPAAYQTYEAESPANTLSQGLQIKTCDATYAGGGKMVYELGIGRSIDFNKVHADQDGEYVLTIYYATVADRKAELLVNGESLGERVFGGNASCTDSYDAQGISWHKLPVTLHKGDNTITLRTAADGWGPNLDRITIQPLPGKTDGLTSVTTFGHVNDTVYDLTGRVAQHNHRGLRIARGKKYIVR